MRLPYPTSPRAWTGLHLRVTLDAFLLAIRSWTDDQLNDAANTERHLPKAYAEALQAERAHRHGKRPRNLWQAAPHLYSPQAWRTHLRTWSPARLTQALPHAPDLPHEYAEILREEERWKANRPWSR